MSAGQPLTLRDAVFRSAIVYAHQLVIPGKVPPKGSARSFAIKRGGAYTGKTVTVQSNAESLATWAARVALHAQQAGVVPLSGPVGLAARFEFPRPKAHYRAGGQLRPDAPAFVESKPDGDKLERALWDALTGVAFGDDRQVARWGAEKVYVGRETAPRTWVWVGKL